MDERPKQLLDVVREVIRLEHYSIRTEEAYVYWIKRYVLFHSKRHPREMGVPEIEAPLTHLAVDQHVAASTQNQALSALLFLYREMLRKTMERPVEAIRAKRPKRLPNVLTKEQVRKVIGFLSGTHQLVEVALWQWLEVNGMPKGTQRPRRSLR